MTEPSRARRGRPALLVPGAAALAVAALAACASGGRPEDPGAGATVPMPVRVQTSPERFTTLNTVPTSVEASSTTVDAPPARAWVALTNAYGELGITPTRITTSQFILAIDNARMRRQLGNAPMSRYLDCGMGQSGPNSVYYEVTVNLQSQLVPLDSARADVRTLLTGTARPVGVSGTPVTCQTTSVLEQRIASLVASKVRGQ